MDVNIVGENKNRTTAIQWECNLISGDLSFRLLFIYSSENPIGAQNKTRKTKPRYMARILLDGSRKNKEKCSNNGQSEVWPISFGPTVVSRV